MTDGGEVRADDRPGVAWGRVVAVSLLPAAVLLWAWSGWTPRVGIAVVAGVMSGCLPLVLFRPARRSVVPGPSAAVAAVFVTGWLATQVAGEAVVVAVGVAVAAAAVQARRALPAAAAWSLAGTGVVVAAFSAGTAWTEHLADRRPGADPVGLGDLPRPTDLGDSPRPTDPEVVFERMVAAIHHGGGPPGVCHLFTERASRQFAQDVGATTCDEAIRELHEQVGRRWYSRATTDDITYGTPATISGCRMAVRTDSILDSAKPPGPRFGTMRLEIGPEFPGTGYMITDYQPCPPQ